MRASHRNHVRQVPALSSPMPYEISYPRLLHSYPPHRKFWLETDRRPATSIISRLSEAPLTERLRTVRGNASKLRRAGTPPNRAPRIVIAIAAESRIRSLGWHRKLLHKPATHLGCLMQIKNCRDLLCNGASIEPAVSSTPWRGPQTGGDNLAPSSRFCSDSVRLRNWFHVCSSSNADDNAQRVDGKAGSGAQTPYFSIGTRACERSDPSYRHGFGCCSFSQHPYGRYAKRRRQHQDAGYGNAVPCHEPSNAERFAPGGFRAV